MPRYRVVIDDPDLTRAYTWEGWTVGPNRAKLNVAQLTLKDPNWSRLYRYRRDKPTWDIVRVEAELWAVVHSAEWPGFWRRLWWTVKSLWS